jgi:hypothetical protein
MQAKETPSDHVPFTTSLEFSDESGPFIIDVELASVNGRIACVGFGVRSYARDQEEFEAHDSMELPLLMEAESTITASLLRRVKVAETVAGAIQHLRSDAETQIRISEAIPDSFDDWLLEAGQVDDASGWQRRQFELEKDFYGTAAEKGARVIEQPAHEGRGPGRPPIPDDTLREVAHLYSEAYRTGDRAPVKYVARQLGRPHKQVKGWVVKARQKGFLPPTLPGAIRGATETEDDSS